MPFRKADCPCNGLFMGRILHGASFPWGESSIRRVADGASCQRGELSLWRVIHGASRPWGESSMGQVVKGQDVIGDLSGNRTMLPLLP